MIATSNIAVDVAIARVRILRSGGAGSLFPDVSSDRARRPTEGESPNRIAMIVPAIAVIPSTAPPILGVTTPVIPSDATS
jgi:hypothetical protein